jgi:hypothetical protein
MQDLETRLWARVQTGQPVLRLGARWASAGQGLMLGVLGGFRTAVADILWLRMAGAWEARDGPATERWLELVTAIDPEPLYFWINGARIIAYDLPEWTGGKGGGSEAIAARRVRAHAERAVLRLQEARRFHPTSAALWIEQANLELNRLGDVRAAAASYRRAWEQPGAPYYAARLHAEMLRRLDEPAAALDWLVRLHPQLPAADEAAGAALVLARIRQLETELGLPEEQAYVPR